MMTKLEAVGVLVQFMPKHGSCDYPIWISRSIELECLDAIATLLDLKHPSACADVLTIPTLAPCDEASVLLANCITRSGKIDRRSVLGTLGDLIRFRNRCLVRLGLLLPLRFRDVETEK